MSKQEDIVQDTEENQETSTSKEGIKEEKKSKAKKAPRKNKKEEQIKELEVILSEQKDKYLRLFSEFDNYRKRTSKERIELLRTASEGMILKMLPVLDDCERALQLLPEEDSSREGIVLIYSKLKSTLEKEGLKEIEAKGAEFDVDFHEALTRFPAPEEAMKGKVIEVIEKGYMLNEKVVRFAKVAVGA